MLKLTVASWRKTWQSSTVVVFNAPNVLACYRVLVVYVVVLGQPKCSHSTTTFRQNKQATQIETFFSMSFFSFSSFSFFLLLFQTSSINRQLRSRGWCESPTTNSIWLQTRGPPLTLLPPSSLPPLTLLSPCSLAPPSLHVRGPLQLPFSSIMAPRHAGQHAPCSTPRGTQHPAQHPAWHAAQHTPCLTTLVRGTHLCSGGWTLTLMGNFTAFQPYLHL